MCKQLNMLSLIMTWVSCISLQSHQWFAVSSKLNQKSLGNSAIFKGKRLCLRTFRRDVTYQNSKLLQNFDSSIFGVKKSVSPWLPSLAPSYSFSPSPFFPRIAYQPTNYLNAPFHTVFTGVEKSVPKEIQFWKWGGENYSPHCSSSVVLSAICIKNFDCLKH